MNKKQTTVKYGLWHNKRECLLSFDIESNDRKDFCVPTTYKLRISFADEQPWLVNSAHHAEYVRNFSTPWYNGSYDTPLHNFLSEDLEVLKVVITTELEPINVKIPTIKEYIDEKYKEKDPNHWKYLILSMERNEFSGTYSLYDLEELLRERKKEK